MPAEGGPCQALCQKTQMPELRGVGVLPNSCAAALEGLGEQQRGSVGRDPWTTPGAEDTRKTGWAQDAWEVVPHVPGQVRQSESTDFRTHS